ncbi:legumin B-like [Pistacia vera]|uniref:legumin B-like n=1 Tax=Pistacia vera TaxID=55513 RepID=UPI00126326F1|nr:legumin B-like [Pistacia vera]
MAQIREDSCNALACTAAHGNNLCVVAQGYCCAVCRGKTQGNMPEHAANTPHARQRATAMLLLTFCPPVQSNNILSAFDEEILAQSFNIDTQLARRLQKEKRQRGIIVRVQEDLEVLSPHRQEQEQQYEEERERRQRNGLEETFCTMTLKYNINDPSRADVYNPLGGRVSSVNALNLPILRFLQLSAKKGVLHRNAILALHWNVNAHSIVSITRGNGRIQIVSENGESVFHEEIREGQLVVVPQNFAVVKRASSDRFEWVSFKTNGLSQTSQLAGRVSVFRALPLDAIRNSSGISREDAWRLKESRSEMTIFAPGSSSQRESQSERERQREREERQRH